MCQIEMCRFRFLRLSFLFLLVWPALVYAQQRQVSYHNLQWFQYYQIIQLNPKWNIRSDGGFRWQEGFREKSQFLIRSNLRYDFTSTLNVSAGMALFGAFSGDTLSRREFRTQQQLGYTHSVDKFSLSHRVRIEQRQFFPLDESSSSSLVHRFRYRIMMTWPLLSLSNKNPEKVLSLNLGDEVLFNAGKDIVYNTFSQNRVLIGPSFQLSEALSISLLYNHMWTVVNVPNTYRQNAILWIGVRHSIIRK
ncbi:MAG: DUF2490 domain-containing protein [Bacteroidota bacterium]